MEVALAAGRLVVVVGIVEHEPSAVARQDEHVAAIRLREQALVEHQLGAVRGRRAGR